MRKIVLLASALIFLCLINLDSHVWEEIENIGEISTENNRHDYKISDNLSNNYESYSNAITICEEAQMNDSEDTFFPKNTDLLKSRSGNGIVSYLY